MPTLINTELVRKLPLDDVTIRDTKLVGFMVRCRRPSRRHPNGHASYRVELGRAKFKTIGSVANFTVAEARAEAKRLLAERDLGHPVVTKKTTALTFAAFLDQHYESYKIANHKRGKETVKRLRTVFAVFLNTSLSDLTPFAVEGWRTKRLKQPRSKPDTVNSHLVMLRAALQRAVDWKLLAAHPLTTVTPLKTDKVGRVRYLSPDEETRLRKALADRDETRAARRAAANTWRRLRGYAPYPADEADHLTTVVLVALNTGCRKGELFQLRWSDLDLVRHQLTVRGEGAKSAQTRYVPLNAEAHAVLTEWRKQSTPTPDGYVFPGRIDGEPLDDTKKSWATVVTAAKLDDFTFHDLRHDFASKLAMAGVDLNTIRQLLGHADLKMVLRYAHLSPQHMAVAVEKLAHR